MDPQHMSSVASSTIYLYSQSPSNQFLQANTETILHSMAAQFNT